MAGRVRRWAGVALAGAVLIAPGPAQAQVRSGPVELGAAINDAGFDYGGSRYRDTFTQNYDTATAESAMKMTALQPERGRFDFAQADEIVDWARASGKQVHGHVLIWCADQWNPEWVTNGEWQRATLLAVMEEHIRTVMDHFEGRVASWDVVNEAIDGDAMRRCIWQRVIGDDWVQQAFRIAREADPSARLFYNEYAADVPNRKFEALMRLVPTLSLDGVGLQHHTYGVAPLQYEIEEAIARLGALGLDVHFSEVSVPTLAIGGDRLLQAQAYRTIGAACEAQPACFRITTWGFTDAYGWRPAAEQAMPFDVDYVAKPAWPAFRRGAGREPSPAPEAPGAPAASVPISQGVLDVSWPAVGGDVTYTLQHADADDTVWSTLASGIPGTSFAFTEKRRQREGTWTYRVRAEHGAWSAASAPAKVDRTAPAPPALTPSATWFRDPVKASLAGEDAPLRDGSPGSGVEPAPAQTFATTGVHPLRGTLRDRAGNVSAEGGGELRVDVSPPAVRLDCPKAVVRGARAFAPWTAQDVGSGLAMPEEGRVALRSGPRRGAGAVRRRARLTARDRAGNTTRASCGYRIRSPLRLRTATARVRQGVVRLRVACRHDAPRRCDARLTLRRGGRPVGESRRTRIRRGRARTVAVPAAALGRVRVFAGPDRLGAVRLRPG